MHSSGGMPLLLSSCSQDVTNAFSPHGVATLWIPSPTVHCICALRQARCTTLMPHRTLDLPRHGYAAVNFTNHTSPDAWSANAVYVLCFIVWIMRSFLNRFRLFASWRVGQSFITKQCLQFFSLEINISHNVQGSNVFMFISESFPFCESAANAVYQR